MSAGLIPREISHHGCDSMPPKRRIISTNGTISTIQQLKVAIIICLAIAPNDVCAQYRDATSDNVDGYACEGFFECLPWRSPQQNQPPTNVSDDGCGAWMALSTIPGAGLGVFAGKNYAIGDAIGGSGDIVIPVVDMAIHQPGLLKDEWTFLWSDYVWNSKGLQMMDEGLKDVNGASPGISATMNCFLDLVNAVDWQPHHSMPLDRRKDPGTGAITNYDARWTTATRNIRAGEEFFVTYGDNWFRKRPYMGPIPLEGDLGRASTLFRRYQELIHNASTLASRNNVPSSTLWKDLWSTFATQSAWKAKSRTLGAFNVSNTEAELNELQHKYNSSLFQLRRSQTSRSQHWLEQQGVCVDHLREGPSTLSMAGRGAFATRALSKGTIVAPMPMIHIPYDYRLDMYALTRDANGNKVVEEPKRVVGKQLLLNYCYGHAESTMLLCPYGSDVNIINHNRTLANVRLKWADATRGVHNASLLDQSVAHIYANYNRVALSMELVATRDIAKGEEIFLDYGDEWEAAWQHHVQSWRPHSDSYSAGHWNADKTTRLRTVFEQLGYPYPPNIELKCDQAFLMEYKPIWQPLLNEANSSEALEAYRRWTTEMLAPCDVLRMRYDGHRVLYTTVIKRLDTPNFLKNENYELMVDVPREAFFFVDQPYTSDTFLPNAFRHAIMIPDELFPEAWKNRNISYDKMKE